MKSFFGDFNATFLTLHSENLTSRILCVVWKINIWNLKMFAYSKVAFVE